MPKITQIKVTRMGRYALFSDDGFLFSVDEETFFKQDIHEQDELSEIELEMLREKSDTRSAMNSAGRLLAQRAHSAGELKQKLQRRYDDDTIEAAVCRLSELGMIDDEEFAIQRAKSLALRGKSRMEISAKLYAAGIPRDVAQCAMDELCESEAERAVAVLKKNYMSKLLAGEHKKVMAALLRRGFSYGDAKEAMDTVGEHIDE